MDKILIVGCGFVGCELARRLVAQGDEVWGLRRTAGKLPAGVGEIVADLSAPLPELPAGLTHIVYAASADSRTPDAYRLAYVQGLAHTIDAARHAAELKRLWLVSSTAVYSQTDGEWVTESSEASPESFTGKLLLEGERLLEQSELPHTVLRCSGIYGPGRTRLIDSVRNGKPIDAPCSFTNRIHRDDIAGALSWMMSKPELELPRLIIGTDERPTTKLEVHTWLAGELGVSPPPHEAGPLGGKRLRQDALKQLGYRFLFPDYRAGYAEMLTKLEVSGPSLPK